MRHNEQLEVRGTVAGCWFGDFPSFLFTPKVSLTFTPTIYWTTIFLYLSTWLDHFLFNVEILDWLSPFPFTISNIIVYLSSSWLERVWPSLPWIHLLILTYILSIFIMSHFTLITINTHIHIRQLPALYTKSKKCLQHRVFLLDCRLVVEKCLGSIRWICFFVYPSACLTEPYICSSIRYYVNLRNKCYYAYINFSCIE